MQRITLFTFCLQYIGFEFLDFGGKFDILSFLLKFSQNMIYLDCDNDTDHDPPGPASATNSSDGQKLDSCTGGGFIIEHSYSNLRTDGKKWFVDCKHYTTKKQKSNLKGSTSNLRAHLERKHPAEFKKAKQWSLAQKEQKSGQSFTNYTMDSFLGQKSAIVKKY